jgi:hypothetical protein
LEEERAKTVKRIEKQLLDVENGRRGGQKSAVKRKVLQELFPTPGSTPPSSGGSSHPSTPGSTEGATPLPSRVQPITLHYISNINYPLDFPNVDKNVDNSNILQSKITEILNTNLDDLLLAGNLISRPGNFVKFAVEYWAKEIIAKGQDAPLNRLREHFVDTMNTRLSEIERAYTKLEHSEEWFTQELERLKTPEMTPRFLKKFKDYYLKKMASGSFYFQTFPNFSMEKTLTDWFINERKPKPTRQPMQPVYAVEPTPTYKPTDEEKKKFDDDIKEMLNGYYQTYLKQGETRYLQITHYEFLREFGCDVASESEVRDMLMTQVFNERKKKIEVTEEGFNEEGTRRLKTLKQQYATNSLDDDEKHKILKTAYVRAITDFFEKLKSQNKEKIFVF